MCKKKDFAQRKMFVLKNILLIYELANYLINFLEKFKLDGIADIFQLFQKKLRKLALP